MQPKFCSHRNVSFRDRYDVASLCGFTGRDDGGSTRYIKGPHAPSWDYRRLLYNFGTPLDSLPKSQTVLSI